MPRLDPSKLLEIATVAERNIKNSNDKILLVWDELYKSAAHGYTKKELPNLSKECINFFSSHEIEIVKIFNREIKYNLINDQVIEVENELMRLNNIKISYESKIETLKIQTGYIYLEYWFRNNLDLSVRNDFARWAGEKFEVFKLFNPDDVEEFIFHVEKIIKNKEDLENLSQYIKLKKILNQVLFDLNELESEDFQFEIIENLDDLIEKQESKLEILKANKNFVFVPDKKESYLLSWTKRYDDKKSFDQNTYSINSLIWISSKEGQRSLEKIDELFLSVANSGKKSLTFDAKVKSTQPHLCLVAENKVFDFITLFDFERVFRLLGYIVENKYRRDELISVTLKVNKAKVN